MIQIILRKTKEKWKEESGVIIIEASYVFPITFFVIFFLIYFGNLLYIRAAIASYVSDITIQGAAYCANPWLKEIEANNVVPTKINDIKPYRNLNVLGGNSEYVNEMQEQLKNRIARLGGGFFYGMTPENIVCKAEYKNYIITANFSVHTMCRISFPMNFFGENSPWGFTISVYERAPVIDGCEIIRNIDMGLDYVERSKIAQDIINNIKGLFENAKKTFKVIFGEEEDEEE